jgi:hypothetical protein
VNGHAGGDNTSGKISADGTYTAPANLPASPTSVEISATSHADITKSGSAKINLVTDVTVGALPGARTIFVQNANLDETAASGVLEIH